MSELKLFIRLFSYIFIPLVVVYATYSYMQDAFFEPVKSGHAQQLLVEISPHMSFDQVAQLIEEKGIVRSSSSLRIISRLRRLSTSIKAGEYMLSPSMTPTEVLTALVNGKIYLRNVTIQAGQSIWEIGKTVEEAGLLSEANFNKDLTNAALLAKAGVAAESFEGYLFPGTYQLSRPIRADQIIWKMLEAGDQSWQIEYTDQANVLKLSRHEVLTLASIIQKETGFIDEAEIISSVLHNRLNQGMKLRSDATVIYGIKDFQGALTDEDRQKPSAYNTYLNFGLPPAPLCNPGEGAIRAALFPRETSFLFYMKQADGRHAFASTQAEYNEAVRRIELEAQDS